MFSIIPKRFSGKVSQIKLKTVSINVKSNEVQTNKQSILQVAILINQTLNSFIFPFPIKWNNIRKKYYVNIKLLQFYWCMVLLKFAYIFIAIFLVTQAICNENFHDGRNAGQLLFLMVTILAVTSFADSVFINTAYDTTNSFNWSYKMQNSMLAGHNIGKFVFY